MIVLQTIYYSVQHFWAYLVQKRFIFLCQILDTTYSYNNINNRRVQINVLNNPYVALRDFRKVLNHLIGILNKPEWNDLVEISAKSGIQLLLFGHIYKLHERIEQNIFLIIKKSLIQMLWIDANSFSGYEGQSEASRRHIIETWFFCH